MSVRKSYSPYIRKCCAVFWPCLSLFLVWWFLSQQYARDLHLYDYDTPKDAQWIVTQDEGQYTGCFRKELDLNSDVRSAWLGVVSEGGFELLCNGDPVGAQTYWRPTRPFQNGLSASGQRVLKQEPMIAYNFPREYQWSGHNNAKIIIFFDLRPYLKKGKNVLAIEAEARRVKPAVIAFGGINLKNGEKLNVVTDSSWKAEPVPRKVKQGFWTKSKVSVAHWKHAGVKRSPVRSFVSCVPPALFENVFDARWIVARKSDYINKSVSTFTADFDVLNPEEAWVRVLSHGNYWLWLNGKRLEVSRSKAKGYNGGEWMVSWEGRRPLATPPILLDPDEASGFFGGYRFETPRHGDPTVNDFKLYENTLNRTRERPNSTGDNLLADGEEEKGRLQDPYGFLEEADPAVPHSLLRERARAQFHAYDVTSLVRSGSNRITVRLIDDRDYGYQGSQPLRFAMDGSIQQVDGKKVQLSNLNWKLNHSGVVLNAVTGSQVVPTDLPVMMYMGGGAPGNSRVGWSVVCGLVFIGFLFKKYWCFVQKPLIVFGVVLVMAWVFQMAFAERSEILWFISPIWGFVAVSVAFVCALFSVLFRAHFSSGRWFSGWGGGWLCLGFLIVVFLLRAWMVHHQPIDDDEYASIQAVLSIAETGKPLIGSDIWYSRSPLYHYVVAGVVKVFGPHIWSLRLYSVILSVLTGWVLWFMARRYFKSLWIAGAALLIFALHPFLIFSGHIARFYQQQQLMVLVMVYLFIQGFIYKQSVWHRVGAILAFAMAVLSQEISISFVPVFFVAYLLFGRGVPFSWEWKSILYIAFAGVLIAADILLFKVKCITRGVGVSPNVEATLAPTFWELGNLFSMFVGYTRLHLMLSFFYVLSLVYSIRRGSSCGITLHAFLVVSIVAFNLIITSVSFRYMYSLIPLWILLGVHGMNVLGIWLSGVVNRGAGHLVRWVALVLAVLSFSPWRILQSYEEKILGDPISSLGYVKSEMRPDDKIMITEPHPHAAKIELGRVDYDLVVPILYDFTYNKEGVLRDRNGDAIVVNRLADLQKIFTEDSRVWIVINREKFRSRKKNIRWEYPGAREELFIRQNCELRYRSYLWSVYLWDRSLGDMDTFRKEPQGWLE